MDLLDRMAECEEQINAEDCEFKNSPLEIVIIGFPLARLVRVGKCNFYSKLKILKLFFDTERHDKSVISSVGIQNIIRENFEGTGRRRRTSVS